MKKTTTTDVATSPAPMTAKERDALRDAVKLQMKVARANVDEYAAAQKADMEGQLSKEFTAEDADLAEIMREAEADIGKTKAKIDAMCKARGIRRSFGPQAYVHFDYRGENSVKDRRAELRGLGNANIDARRKEAYRKIETWGAEAQIKLIAGALTSAEAKEFLESMPTVEALLPGLTLAQLDALSTRPGLRLIQGQTDNLTGTGDE
ncbi:hypothetical protein [Paraburkholderia sp. J7]|uniref:hypothetical protein n=1 Tax=Paraburkholderia sp. J7 TaxID=2805438 RepID=UPI002AB75475|nr:hypothetical protein [Paraburkholderia sp. J7]